MDDETREVAKDKANKMNERIGYPDILTNSVELEKEYINVTFNLPKKPKKVLNPPIKLISFSAHSCRKQFHGKYF